MEMVGSVVAVYGDHNSAEAAVKKLIASGFETKNLSVVGKGYHTDEKVVGFYTTGDRVKFWGTRGAFWGGFWGLLFGGLFMTIPLVGHVVVLGYLATVVLAGIENAIVVGGLSALGAALYSLGIPKDSVLAYETAIKADDFLVMARGSADETARAKTYSPQPTRLAWMCTKARTRRKPRNRSFMRVRRTSWPRWLGRYFDQKRGPPYMSDALLSVCRARDPTRRIDPTSKAARSYGIRSGRFRSCFR